MDVRLVKARHVLNGKGETGVVWLTQNMIYQGLLSKVIHDPRSEVALEAPRRWDVDLEIRESEWPCQDAATACMTSDVERILFGSRFDIGSISSKSVGRVKDGCLVDGCAVVVDCRCVKRPIPVSVKLA